jgi:hypothetical protein
MDQRAPKSIYPLVATGGGVVAGVSATMSHIAHREQKREQLKMIKQLEINREEVLNRPRLDDITRGIRLDQLDELLKEAIVKFNRK